MWIMCRNNLSGCSFHKAFAINHIHALEIILNGGADKQYLYLRINLEFENSTLVKVSRQTQTNLIVPKLNGPYLSAVYAFNWHMLENSLIELKLFHLLKLLFSSECFSMLCFHSKNNSPSIVHSNLIYVVSFHIQKQKTHGIYLDANEKLELLIRYFVITYNL